MNRRIVKMLLTKIAEILFMAFIAIAMVFCLIKFINAEDVCDKVEYGISVVICLILTLREW